jgi:uncharacterized membrane protein
MYHIHICLAFQSFDFERTKFQDTKEVIRRQYNTMTKRYQRGNQKDRQYNTMTERYQRGNQKDRQYNTMTER